MRALTPAFVATSVVIALAGTAAQAQIGGAARGTAPSATTTTTTSTPSNATVGGYGASGSAGTTAGSSVSGTSSGDAFTGSSRSATSGQTAGSSVSGTSSGDAFSGSSRGNAPPVGPAAGNNGLSNPVDRNASGAIFNANGERLFVPEAAGVAAGTYGTGGMVSGSPASGYSANDNAGAGNGAAGGTGAADVRTGATTTPELDQAARREAQRIRKTVERKGQMMNSIAPRTEVDRTNQMPDDSTPLLSPARR
jgi:hypothetical protein